jgi:hypothetical protein
MGEKQATSSYRQSVHLGMLWLASGAIGEWLLPQKDNGSLTDGSDVRSKLGQICTDFEEDVGKSARNRGIDHSEPGETASHLVSSITIL